MLAYNHPSLSMVFVAPTAEFTEAVSIPVPDDFYKPKTIWKLQISGQTSPVVDSQGMYEFKSGQKFVRRVLLGDLVVSELFGVSRGNYPLAFSDTITFVQYADQLFDVSSVGHNTLTPPYEVEEDSLKHPRCASAELVMSHADGPNPDRTLPISIQFWVEPISSPAVVMLEQCSLIGFE